MAGRFFAPGRGRRGLIIRSLLAVLLIAGGVVAPAQVIDSFSPFAGTPGEKILIGGSGFTSGSIRVFFWNGAQAAIQVTSDSYLTATIPSGATTGVLTIQRGSETPVSTSTNFTIIGRGPYITDLTPTYGDSSTMVEISGVHLTNVAPNGVRFNGVASTDANPTGNGMLVSVHVPAGAPVGPGLVSVTTPYGTSNAPVAFNVVGPGPYIARFGPDHGTPGTWIQIYGMHLASCTNATFGGIKGTNFNASQTLITVYAPTGVTTGPITVNSSLGTFTSVSNFYVPPVITGVSPASGRAGTNVTLTGSNFRGATALTFNGTPANFTVVSNHTIATTVPTGARSGLIQLFTPDFSCTNSFKVLPTIYGFAPTFGRPGTNVMITGANFNAGGLAVFFNGVQATSVSNVSFGQLTATVPAGATTTGLISVSTVDGSHTNANLFYLPARITDFTPKSGDPGTPLTVTGLNFTDASSLSFNGIPAFFTVSSNSSIAAFVPNNAVSGPITITTPAGSASSSLPFYGAPRVTSFTPTVGQPGTNVTIIGTNFLDATAVRFNGQSATFTYVNNGKLTATAPAGVQTGPITVEAPGGTNTSIGSFTAYYPSDLEVWITASPDPVTATSNLLYSITVVNHGPLDAPAVRLTNTLPSSVRLISATMDSPWTLLTNINQLIATADNIAPGGTTTLSVNVAPQSPGTIVAGANVASDNTDPAPGNNSVTITTTVQPLPLLFINWWTNQVKLSWHVGLSNFVLESTAAAQSNALWAAVTNIPVILGTQKWVVQSNTAPAKYYRLKK